MSGRVVAIEPLLRLDLSSLAASETSRVVLARAVDVVSADEATLRVAVIAVDQFAVTPAQFFVELRPVVLGDGPEGDWVGDVVAEAAIDEKSVGKLVMAAVPEPVGGAFQVAVRGTQNATPGALVLVASVDVVLKEGPVDRQIGRSELAAAARGRLEAQAKEVESELTLVASRIAELRQHYGPAGWLDVAAMRLLELRAFTKSIASAAQRDRGCCRSAPPSLQALPDSVVHLGAARPLRELTGGPRRAREDGPSRDCGTGVCCRDQDFPAVVDGPFGPATEMIAARICFPSSHSKDAPSGLVVFSHGAPEGMGFDPFDPMNSGKWDSLQADLARAGIVSVYASAPSGLNATSFHAVVDAMKLWIVAEGAADPGGPLAAIDVENLPVALCGHSQAGPEAVYAASLASGKPVRAVVNFAGGPLVEPVVLHPGTYFLGILGTHDASPSVGPIAPVETFERVVTDRPRVLVVLPGAGHPNLGPVSLGGLGVAHVGAGDTGPASAGITTPPRNYAALRFLEWALLGDRDAGRDLFVDAKTSLVFTTETDGSSLVGWWGPEFTPYLLRTASQQPPLAPFTQLDVYSPGGPIDLVGDGFVEPLLIELLSTEHPGSPDIPTTYCDGVPSPAFPSRSSHQLTQVAVLPFDRDRGETLVRVSLPSPLSDIVGALADQADFSLKVDLALRENGRRTLKHQAALADIDGPLAKVPWWPRLGLGDEAGPQIWWSLCPVLVGWGFPCSFRLENEIDHEVRETTLTTVCVRLPLLLPNGIGQVTHAHLNLAGLIRWWTGDAVLASVAILSHGGF